LPEAVESQLRTFWSGTLTFGLVTLPVGFLPAYRARGVSLRMVTEDGTPLRRRYWCPREERLIEDEEIVRGYEIDKGRFVVVTDEELEALEPQKTREIDLRLFVEAASVDPIYFERAYFLAPLGDATKAYRLLAQAMEDSGQAGVGTFVMRTKQYVVAIFAENGILRAETLRFADEIRAWEDAGLPETGSAPRKELQRISAAMGAREADELDWEELEDRYAEKLERLVARKLEAGEDVVELPPEAEPEGPEVIDIMEVLKRSLKGSGKMEKPDRDGRARRAEMPGSRDLEKHSREELYRMAQEREIPGRSRMSKEELVEALRRSA
jgi:DNA end-binding protein Ku